MAKKTAASSARGASARKTTTTTKSRSAASTSKAPAAKKAAPAPRSVKKHVGDVLGISRATVSKSVPSGGRRPKGIEISTRKTGLKPFRVVGGVRGRGR